jgi:hypothetical protein
VVKKIDLKSKKVFQCEECKLYYDDKLWAQKCEEWCKNHHTCNIEISKHRIRENINKGKD